MGRSSIPEWVATRLQPKEVVLAHAAASSVDYYATDKRLFRFSGRNDCESVPYESLTIARRSVGMFLNMCRGLLALMGLACTTAAIYFGLVGPTIRTGSMVLHTRMPPTVAYLFLALGLFALFISLAVVGYRYEIAVIDQHGRIQRRWRLQLARWGSGDVHQLARVLGEKTK